MKVIPVLLLLGALALPCAGFNLLANPSFETWLLGLPVGWLTSEPLAESSATQDPDSHSGQWCVRLTGTDTSAFATTVTAVRAGFHYRFNGWVNTAALLAGSFVIQFTTLLAQPVGAPTLVPAYRSNAYREYERWVTAPESAALVSISFATLPNVRAWIDDFTLEDTTFLGVEETPVALPAGACTRKLLLLPGMRLDPGARVYEMSGRRLDPARARPFKAYFIREERQ